MKTFITIATLILFFSTFAKAQTAIDKNTVDGSAVLDFAAGTTKGIILPAVQSLPANPANGTFLLDKTDQKIKMFENGTWVNLSGVGQITSVLPYNGTTSNTGKKTVMGSNASGADGVLVLESADKALVLPKVADPHLNVKSPYPGMMCYDTTKQALAVFDGKLWNYWK